MSSAEMVTSTRRSVIFGTADPTLAERLARETERYTRFGVISPAPDFAELRRQLAIGSPHVILINPLTGILGNAELVLSHRDRIPAADRQRLQTIVDLAVSLCETTRRLSNTWESQSQSLRPA